MAFEGKKAIFIVLWLAGMKRHICPWNFLRCAHEGNDYTDAVVDFIIRLQYQERFLEEALVVSDHLKKTPP